MFSTEAGDRHSGSDGLPTLGGVDSVNCESQWTGSYNMNSTLAPAIPYMLNFQRYAASAWSYRTLEFVYRVFFTSFLLLIMCS